MRSGQRFYFIVDGGIVVRMDRIIMINHGRIIARESGPEGTEYEVEKS
jgi:hypothetical protein